MMKWVFSLVLILLVEWPSASGQVTQEALLDSISTTIAEVAWTGKHNQVGGHLTVTELLVNETVRRAEPEIKQLQKLLERSDPETLAAVIDQLTKDSVKKVDALDHSDDDELAPRFLCLLERGVRGNLALGVSEVIGGMLAPIGVVGGCRRRMGCYPRLLI